MCGLDPLNLSTWQLDPFQLLSQHLPRAPPLRFVLVALPSLRYLVSPTWLEEARRATFLTRNPSSSASSSRPPAPPSPDASLPPSLQGVMTFCAEPLRTPQDVFGRGTYTNCTTSSRASRYWTFCKQKTSTSFFPSTTPFTWPLCVDGQSPPAKAKILRLRPFSTSSRIQGPPPPLSSDHLPPELDLLQLAMREIEGTGTQDDSASQPPNREDILQTVLGPPAAVSVNINGTQHLAYIQDVVLLSLLLPTA